MNPDKFADCCENTDREIWRAREGDTYSDSIHVTKEGAIGINCGGLVIVKPVRHWFRLSFLESAALLPCSPASGPQYPLDSQENRR